jgi:5-methylcytosine-specific restriction enzyme subunit McrC
MLQTIELAEYETTCEPSAPPTAADQRLAEQLSAAGEFGARLDVRWLVNNTVEITASSWVGSVSFSALEVRVIPKLAGGTLRVLRMIEYADGVRLLSHLPRDQRLPGGGNDLFDLIVMAFVGETKWLIRDGLLRDYRPMDDTLTVMRGRLRIRDQFLRRYGSLHQLECHFEEYDGDIPENQLLAAALIAAATRVRGNQLRTGTRILAGRLGDVCEPPTADPEWYRQRIHYDRRNERYRPAHELDRLILSGLALNDLATAGYRYVTAFMLNMNTLFERFVTRLVENSLAGSNLRVSSQSTLRAVIVDERTGRTYSTIRPDLLVIDATTGVQVPIDIKYKLYGAQKIGSTDIYQLFLYAYALGGESSSRIAGLIYPAVTDTAGHALHIKPVAGSAAAHIRGAGLNVPAILDSLSAGDAEMHEVHEAVQRRVCSISGLAATCGIPSGAKILRRAGRNEAEHDRSSS